MRIRYAGKLWDVWLEDDGTLDTVISVSPVSRPSNTTAKHNQYPSDSRGPYYPKQYTRFDSEYASNYRRPNGEMTMRGLRILGLEACEDAADFFDFEDTPKPAAIRLHCDQCQLLSINGLACHEHGCPNSNSRFDADSQTWIKQRKCFECGCTVDADDSCCSAPMEDNSNEETN